MKIPEYPGVNLTICIFYLAQLTVVGNDYTGLALFVDDLLTGDAPGQFLRRSGDAALLSIKTANAKTTLFMTSLRVEPGA
jgi:hypothetical protein